MKKVLVFGGTSDARELTEALSKLPCAVTVSVASDYGQSMLPKERAGFSVLVGRMDALEMKALIQHGGYTTIIDATHPYATNVTANIQTAAQQAGALYIRLSRDRSQLEGVTLAASASEAAALLKSTDGNILLATGSKELATYTSVPDFAERLFPRVLPAVDSIEACVALGYKSSHIVAVQGPFSKDFNVALMRQFNIGILVTKDGGKNGGFPEKLEAARDLGARVIVISRPDDDGLSQPEIIQKVQALLEAEQ